MPETPEGVALALLNIILASEGTSNVPPIKPAVAHILDLFTECMSCALGRFVEIPTLH